MNSTPLPFTVVVAAMLFQASNAAPLLEPPPSVHFATTCRPAVAGTFDRAVTVLHSFWFSEALSDFHHVLDGDPGCAMAYWGLAMTEWGLRTHPGAIAAGADAVKRAEAMTSVAADKRESAYIRAAARLFADVDHIPPRPRILAYVAAMKQLTSQYPGDHEAVLFCALGILDSVVPTDKTYAARLEAGAMLEREFKIHPDHPGVAHYIIHAYDVPPLASRALDAARQYARIAPDVPHALHMPSHIFTRLGYWEESIQSNIRSAAAAKREGPSGTGERLHALDYAVYAYLQGARDNAALRIVTSIPLVVRNSGAAFGSPNPFAAAAIPARYALERHAWTEAARLATPQTSVPSADAITHFARALGLAHTRQLAAARREVETLDSLVDELKVKNDRYWAEQVDIERLAALGWIALVEREPDEGLRLLRTAADREDATEKAGTTPGPLLPSRELLGDALLDTRPAMALAEYSSALANEPNRFRTVWGCARAAELAGNRDLARRYYGQLVKMSERADGPERPEIARARAVLSIHAKP